VGGAGLEPGGPLLSRGRASGNIQSMRRAGSTVVACIALAATPAPGGALAQEPGPDGASSCPVTAPTPYSVANGTGYRYGTRRLFTAPPTRDGIVRARPGESSPALDSDGSVRSKFPWFSRTERGLLRISGRRLDGEGHMRLRRRRGPRPGFWATRLVFPSTGCWKVNARVNRVRIAFVMLLVAAE
jgi:hypothetical protein